jgi:hypothetical protein
MAVSIKSASLAVKLTTTNAAKQRSFLEDNLRPESSRRGFSLAPLTRSLSVPLRWLALILFDYSGYQAKLLRAWEVPPIGCEVRHRSIRPTRVTVAIENLNDE